MARESENPSDECVQSAAHAQPTQREKEALSKAKGCFDEVRQAERSALLKAKEAGDWLIVAHEEVDKRKASWQDVLETEFQDVGSRRSAYKYEAIAKTWDTPKAQRARENNPDLSIAEYERKVLAKPAAANSNRKEKFIKRLALKFSKLLRSWDETKLSHLVNDPKFMDEIDEAARKRTLAAKHELEKNTLE